MAKDGETQKGTFSLPQEKVLVKPIIRQGQWLPKGHSGNWMYDNTKITITVPIDRDTGKLKNPLTKEEQEFFESSKSGFDFSPGELSPYRKKDNYWSNYQVFIRKTEEIVGDDTVLRVLDLSDPSHYLEYKVLMSNTSLSGGRVAPSWEERENSGDYKIVLVREGQQHVDKVRKSDKMKKAYAYFGKLDSSADKMYDFLYVYYLNNADMKRPSQTSSKDFLQSEIQDIVDKDVDGFLEIANDEEGYELKLLVMRAVEKGVLNYSRTSGFETQESVPLGRSLPQAVIFLKDTRNQEEFIRIKNQVELAK